MWGVSEPETSEALCTTGALDLSTAEYYAAVSQLPSGLDGDTGKVRHRPIGKKSSSGHRTASPRNGRRQTLDRAHDHDADHLRSIGDWWYFVGEAPSDDHFA